MGTQAINNLMNEVFYGQPDNKKDLPNDADFMKAFEDAQNLGDLENLSKRDVNPVDELTGKEEFEKERTFVRKDKDVSETDSRTEKVESTEEVKSEKIEKSDDVKSDKNVEKTETDDEISEEDIEFVEENFTAFVNAYSELLDIPKDQVIEYFEENDIKIDTLLDVSNVKDIVLGLEGIEDSTEILTNQSLFENIESMKNFTYNLLNEISEELDIDTKDVVSKVGEMLSQIENSEVIPEIADLESNEIKSVDNKLVKNDTDYKVSDDLKTDSFETTITNGNTVERKTDSEKSKDSTEQNQNPAANTFTNVSNAETTNFVSEVPEETLAKSFEAQEIYNQIGEFIRNVSDEELKEVTLQLQPETLGTIQVRVSQREGVLTAEMLTQNDTVKAALEGQLIELQKDFEKSGIKVESIEVKVSTQSFNEQAQEDARNEENEASRRELPPRRINLNGLFETDDLETLEDDERIAVEMMTANGNSLDYQA